MARSAPDTTETRKIIELLKHRHVGSEWATFVELNVGTGSHAGQRIDLYAFNMFPSKNYLRVAYEVKVSRADFARELEKPKKREFAEKVANECYFAMPAGLVRPDEIPEGWGLIEAVKNGMRVKKRAQQRKVEDMPLHFVAAMARRSSDSDPELPAAIWSVAGQEVDLKTLKQIATDEVMKKVDDLIIDAVVEARQNIREQYDDAIQLQQLVRDRIGWQYGEPEALLALLQKQELQLPRHIRSRLSSISEQMDEVKRHIAKVLE